MRAARIEFRVTLIVQTKYRGEYAEVNVSNYIVVVALFLVLSHRNIYYINKSYEVEVKFVHINPL